MKKLFKRVLSGMLAMAMLFSCMSISIAAEKEPTDETNTGLITVSVTDVELSKSSTEQSASILFYMDKNAQLGAAQTWFSVVEADAPLTLGTGIPGTGLAGAVNDQSMVVSSAGGAYVDYSSEIDGYVICTVPVTIAADAVGTYTVSFTKIELYDADNGDGYEVSAEELTATVRITEAATGDGYSLSVAPDATNPDPVRVDDALKVNIAANKEFNSAELKLTYDSTKVEFNEASSTLNGAKVTNANGTLTLADYGPEQSGYTLAFKALDAGSVKFSVTSAGFGTGTTAETMDLEPVEDLSNANTTIVISPKAYNVTLPEDGSLVGESIVEAGADYTFTYEQATGAYYDYTVSATMDGEPVEVIDNNDGSWTIENVSGDLVITATRTPKSFGVTWSGSGAADMAEKPETATYNTDFVFTLPTDIEAGTELGYTYAVGAVTIGGTTYTGYSKSGTTVTIPGADITGAVTIEILKNEVAANQFAVNIEGPDMTADKTVVNQGDSVTLTLAPEAGYTYTVTVNDTPVELTGNQYVVENVQATVNVVVTKTLNTANAKAEQYVTLDGSIMWLVTISPDGNGGQLAEKVYTYNGSNMYWSSAYNAYCYLVVAETAPTLENVFAIVTAANATSVNYDKDINCTGNVDANDAQLVYNMYSADYAGFTANVTMMKFLKADVNGDRKLDVTDAAAIIDSILNAAN